jgi:carbon-monoxide dehydrogenase large subunit
MSAAASARANLYPEQVVVLWAASAWAGREVDRRSQRAFLADYQGATAPCAPRWRWTGKDILAYDVEWFGNVGAHTVTFVPMSNGRHDPDRVSRSEERISACRVS